MKTHIFRKIFLLYFIVLLLSMVFIEVYVTNIVRSNYIDELKQSLLVQTGLLAESMSFNKDAMLDTFCRKVSEQTRARVSVIASDGKVMGDSHNDAGTMENHAGRPEIQQASISGSGSSIRYSSTTHQDLLYVARKAGQNNKTAGFIRLAVPLADINHAVNALRLKINLVVIMLLLMSGAVWAWQTERIRKYVTLISEYAGRLSHGLFRRKLYLEGAGEFSELADSLNQMAHELETTISKRNEETNRLSAVLKSIPDAFLLINTSDIIELSNNAAKELFGVSRLEGRSYIEIVRSTEFTSLLDKVRKGRSPGSADFVLDFPEEIYLAVRVSPLSYSVGELAGFVAIFHDMTKMKKLEQMRKDFVANVSHEIRTPVTSIQGFAETLLDGAIHDQENAGKFLETIKTHSERLSRLVEDLMTLSKIELGVTKIHKKQFELADVIDSAAATMIVQAAKKNLDIKKSFASNDNMIDADRDRVEQIFLNLLDNAIKFTDSGEIEAGTAKEGSQRYFYVKDTGPGIPQKYIPRVGERFFRVDPSRSRELGGTGLGLAIVKHIVMAHGWKMKIESEVGKGTIVKVFY